MNDVQSEEIKNHKVSVVPTGKTKSGRDWKRPQKVRSSLQKKTGILEHLRKSFEEKEKIREYKLNLKCLERQMIEETKSKKEEARRLREERKKLRIANELKSTTYQALNSSKIKGMSKKQLRLVKKTSVNKFGQVELQSPWSK